MSAALNRKLGQAQERLQAGDAAGARFLCEEVLARAPRNPDALYLLAVTHLVTARAHDAIATLERALAVQPRHGAALENLGLAHLMLGEFGAAERALRSAAAIPGAPASVFMRLGVALLNQDRLAEAVRTLEQALALDPRNPDIHLNLGLVSAKEKDMAAARGHFEAALHLDPAHADSMFNLGVIYLEEQQPAEARTWFERVLVTAPHRADALVNLGLVAQQEERMDEAIGHFRRAIELDPSMGQARNNLAHALALNGQPEQSRVEYLTAVRAAPEFAEAREGLASVCIALGRFKEGIVHLRELLRVDSQRTSLLVALADALFEIGELEEAAATARRAMELDPKATGPYVTLADIHFVRGEFDLTAATLQSGVEQTGAVHLQGRLAFQLRRLCDWEKWRVTWQQFSAAMIDTHEVVSPFSLLCEPLTAAEQLVYARRWSGQFNSIDVNRERAPAPPAHRERVRLGYFSSDFYEHATAYLLAEVLELHDRTRFEVFAFSYGPEDKSPMRTRLRQSCEHFVDIASDPDDVAAQRIRTERLDILIDLKGYTMGARPTILARRPCHIQISWLGYPGTMGADFIDCLIADPFIVPVEHEGCYSERVLRMPHCYQPNDRKREVSAPLARSNYGLRDEAFVFCCFNQAYKITPDVFACWMKLLQAVPGSMLWLLEDNRWSAENLRRAAQLGGIEPARLVFAPKLPLAQHLARYQVADLALDTFPYTSHTTASDALWAGCPLVALCGQTFAARVSGSVLTACGLPELITHSLDEYEKCACRLATDQPFRDDIRARLSAAKDNAPLFSTADFVRDLERLYCDVAKHH